MYWQNTECYSFGLDSRPAFTATSDTSTSRAMAGASSEEVATEPPTTGIAGTPDGAPAVDDAEMPAVDESEKGFKKADDILASIRSLKNQQSELRKQKLIIAKQLRNQEKRKSRLKKKARLLSDVDLLALIRMRSDELAGTDSLAASSSHTPAPVAGDV